MNAALATTPSMLSNMQVPSRYQFKPLPPTVHAVTA